MLTVPAKAALVLAGSGARRQEEEDVLRTEKAGDAPDRYRLDLMDRHQISSFH